MPIEVFRYLMRSCMVLRSLTVKGLRQLREANQNRGKLWSSLPCLTLCARRCGYIPLKLHEAI
jgi:hypothetical protein